MQDLICPKCGQRVQASEAALCTCCNGTMAGPTPPITQHSEAIATPQHAAVLTGRPFDDKAPPVPSVRRGLMHLLQNPAVVVIAVIAVTGIGLSIPLILKARRAQQRAASTNNLKTIGLASHSFHDANKRLPYNGVTAPITVGNLQYHGPEPRALNFQSGSAFFQISSFMDERALFHEVEKGGDLPGVSVWMCPGRGRDRTWSTGGANTTLTAAGAPGPEITSGPWSDYVINSYINANVRNGNIVANKRNASDTGALNAWDNKRTLVGITDGTSNTIFFGHGQIAQADYGSTTAVPGYRDSALHGGTAATAANPHPTAIVLARDLAAAGSVTAANRGWGSPFAEGCLMCMGDATVRMFPYSLSTLPSGVIPEIGVSSGFHGNGGGFAQFLTPTGGEVVFMHGD